MRENILFSLLAGIIAYSLTVLVSLLAGVPLPKVLYNGLIALFLISVGVFLLTFFLDKSDFEQFDNKQSSQNNKATTNESQNSEIKNEDDEDFSPMDPTVLEVEEEEEN